jgi:hypothetical protein
MTAQRKVQYMLNKRVPPWSFSAFMSCIVLGLLAVGFVLATLVADDVQATRAHMACRLLQVLLGLAFALLGLDTLGRTKLWHEAVRSGSVARQELRRIRTGLTPQPGESLPGLFPQHVDPL